MAISLVKGQKIDLTKNNSSLKKLLIGLGWDPVKEKKGLFGLGRSKPDIDVDSSLFMLRNDKLVNNKDIIYFGNLKSSCGGVIHMGDNLTGGGDGDDEQILIDLSKIPEEVNKLVFIVNIYQCIERNQSFGMIKNAFIRVADKNNQNLAMFNLTEDYNGKTALVVAEVYRHNGEWKFAALGEGTNDIAIKDMAKRYL